MGYKLKSAFKPSERKRREFEDIEINLTPIMNLVVVLIPLLLQTVAFINLGRIDYKPPPVSMTTPSQGEESGASAGPAEPTILNLVVNIRDSVTQVSIFGDVSGENYWEIPLNEDGLHNFAELQRILHFIKTEKVEPTFIKTETIFDSTTNKPYEERIYRLEDAHTIRLAATPNLDYQSLVWLLDYTQSVVVDDSLYTLFPQPVLCQLQTVAVLIK